MFTFIICVRLFSEKNRLIKNIFFNCNIFGIKYIKHARIRIKYFHKILMVCVSEREREREREERERERERERFKEIRVVGML